eukprot:1157506-Pelagomonas_calceolata.AAC.2
MSLDFAGVFQPTAFPMSHLPGNLLYLATYASHIIAAHPLDVAVICTSRACCIPLHVLPPAEMWQSHVHRRHATCLKCICVFPLAVVHSSVLCCTTAMSVLGCCGSTTYNASMPHTAACAPPGCDA